MGKLLRPTTVVLGCAALVLGVLLLVLGPTWTAAPAGQAVPRPVPEGDQEVVWLNAATSGVGWERLVASIRRLEKRAELGLKIVDDNNAFPTQTTAVPELAVTWRGSSSRLWFRWYKMTGDLGTTQWVEALAKRSPPPLAIIGGGSSDRARDLARELNELRARVSSPPLLVITTATADEVDLDPERVSVDLMKIYEGRTFRFCFTNRQMAEAVVDFIWSRDELRPDTDPVYLVHWKDDPYSFDLFVRFRQVLSEGGYLDTLRRRQTARQAASDWAWLSALLSTGGVPAGLDLEGMRRSPLDLEPSSPFWSWFIPYSVGTFSQPNYPEAEAAERLLDELSAHPGQRRPLLIMPANPHPARRFVRALMRTAPVEAGRFVVATGDAVDFNVIYRDRLLTWPIQDLPVPFVFFCHRNPVEADAFAPDKPGRTEVIDPQGRSATGTQDLLLYQDIVETLVSMAYGKDRLVGNADDLRARMRLAPGRDGRPRFDEDGNQGSGTGEYVVALLPVRMGERIKPQALLQVWNAQADARGKRRWRLQEQLTVDYTHVPPGVRQERSHDP